MGRGVVSMGRTPQRRWPHVSTLPEGDRPPRGSVDGGCPRPGLNVCGSSVLPLPASGQFPGTSVLEGCDPRQQALGAQRKVKFWFLKGEDLGYFGLDSAEWAGPLFLPSHGASEPCALNSELCPRPWSSPTSKRPCNLTLPRRGWAEARCRGGGASMGNAHKFSKRADRGSSWGHEAPTLRELVYLNFPHIRRLCAQNH